MFNFGEAFGPLPLKLFDYESYRMVKKAAKWYFETAAMLYPYHDIVERERKSLHSSNH